MPQPSLYLDECIDPAMISPLRQRGYDVTSAQLEGARGLDDRAQLMLATQLQRLIVSENARHFRAIHRQFTQEGLTHSGILLVPQSEIGLETLRVSMMLDWIEQTSPDGLASGCFTWDQLQTRLERGDRLPGYSAVDLDRVLGRI
jgi:uncharacterized protein DUF5615